MSSSRYPPPNRDRSPPRYDRKPSGTYPSSLGSSYRGSPDSAPLSSERPPPRGPKADFRGGSSQFSTPARGRGSFGGFPARTGDTWDRERDRDRDRDRDARPAPQSYRARDDERPDLFRRDRDFGPADRGAAAARDSRDARPYAARERSASPAPRGRRDSRESIPTPFARPADTASSYYAPAARGGLGRGRGRGDWDRSRGRNSFVGERDRDLFHPRSRSREGWRDREFDRGRPSPADNDRADRYDRRDFDRSRERDVRGRERDHDLWQPRDHSPARSTSGVAGGPPTAPTPTPASAERPIKADGDLVRRPSFVATPTSAGRRDGEPSDYFGSSRLDASRRDPPPGTPQTPLGSALDYGPPPSLPPAPSPTGEKPPIKPQTPRAEAPGTLSRPFQPPSGPKSVRSAAATPVGPPAKGGPPHDTWPRSEPAARPLRPMLTPTTSAAPVEGSTKKDDLPAESKMPSAEAPERAMPPNVPSGPRYGTAAPAYKPRPSSNEPAGPVNPLTAPRDVAKGMPSAESRSPVIPTGPRLDREAPRSLSATASKIWVSPDYKPKPSIMNQLNKPYQPDTRERQSFVPTGPRIQSSFHGPADKPRFVTGTSVRSAPSGPKALLPTSPKSPETRMTLLPPRPSIHELQQADDVEMSVPASSEDEDDVEDDSFDEEYFAESEERFQQEMEILEARKPPPLLRDGPAVVLLVRLQFLHMILHDTLPIPVSSPVAITKEEELAGGASSLPTGLPSPDRASNEPETTEEEPPHPKGRPIKERSVNPIPTPPIEELPFLSDEARKRTVFADSEDEVEREAVAILLQQEFERGAWDWRSDLDDMHADFRRRYPRWKQEVGLLDQERRELQGSPAPASPAPSAAPSVTPSLPHERTRGARNTTEADLQAAILMSQQSLKEEEERREREAAANSLPNYDSEARVPPMLKPAEAHLAKFEETNRLIPSELALEVFDYLPPEDDFTDEEQTLFITAYCQNPKKWGKIAESLPGRTYQDCIIHYYLTKNHAHYKDIWRRSQPRKRRGRAATKPRSTALMSELVYGEDSEAGPVAVTDSGRPRRAAAPTFGDVASEADSSTPAPQSRKLTATVKDGNSDTTTTKAPRGRKAGIATKTRRTKAQIQADQQALLLTTPDPSAAKVAPVAKAEKGRSVPRAENVVPRPEVAPVAIQRAVETGAPPFPVSDLPAAAPAPVVVHNHTAPQVTSYWSVPEQHKFPDLLQYYGRDFAAIADFMKTKSVTMIKNYYLRQLNDGKEDLERLAQLGDQLRMSGKPLGQPPSPIIPPKRRYESTPAAPPVARPAAPIEQPLLNPEAPGPAAPIEQPLLNPEAPGPAAKPGLIEEFPRNAIERNAIGEVVSKPRAPVRDVLPGAAAPGASLAKREELAPNSRAPVYGQKPLHGPRSGVFQDDSLGFGAARQSFRVPIHDAGPQRMGDISRADMGQAPTVPAAASPTIMGPREAATSTQQRPAPAPGPLLHSLQPQSDKFGQHGGFPGGHGRTKSSGGHVVPPALEQHHDKSSFRRMETPKSSLYTMGPAAAGPGSAAGAAPQPYRDMSHAVPAHPPSEAPKPPAKRSNVFGLLNDDPPDPPPKRPSLDGSQRSSILSPKLSLMMARQDLGQHAPSQHQSDDRSARGGYGHAGGLQSGPGPAPAPPADYSGGYGATPVSAPSKETWMDRFDPRPQGSGPEPRGIHHSPGPSHYSGVPAAPQPGGVPPLLPLRAETPRALDRGGLDHRRSLLGQMNQVPHAPSPPPPSASQPIPQYRSTSGSSQHSRVSSMGFGSAQPAGQTGNLGHPQLGPGHHPPGSSGAPVSSVHQRGQSSLDFQPRLTIQQHMAQQNQQKQQEQQREHERHVQRQRELEAVRDRERDQQQQQQQQPQQPPPPSHHHIRRDMYNMDSHPPPGVSRQNQVGAAANQSHIAYAPREIPRTFTPPHGQSHAHSPYPGPGGMGVNHTLSHQHQHHHSNSASASQQAATQMPPHPLHHMHHQQPPPGQNHHPSGGSHYRTLSQGEPRREERR